MNKWYILSAVIITIFCSVAAWYLFPKAFPLVHIELTTNRTDILRKSKEKALLLGIGPSADSCCDVAVAFETDTTTQTFVELEGGGKDAFADMITQRNYEPYRWHVRLFVPQQINEAELYFSPQGTFYGFKEKISENELRTNVSSEQAVAKALVCAKEIVPNFEKYELIESSQHEQISGRIDHTFVYERQDIQLNEGKYRVTMTVSGDKVSACQQYVKIPESFERRYQEMRSYNNNLAFLGLLLMVLLYIIGACCIGLSLYIKEHLFSWKPALLCAGFITFLHFLNQLNQLPLTLMYYDTVTGMHAYITRHVLLILFVSLISFCFFSLIIVVAEGLTRKAFPNHVQLWSVWKQGCANSTAIGIRTLGGYMLCSLDLLLVIVTYLFTSHYFGWWNPSYALVDPNMLATYIPALNSIALSLQAGFIEECLFRAIPLAIATIIGNYFKRTKSFMFLGCIVQAFIFGAAHANYPAQPFYARLVELIIPSCIWGITYIKWGLLPIIICHVLYDVVWFSLPIFISHATGIWVHQCTIIFCTTIPLLIIWYQYNKTKQWHDNVYVFLNSVWQKKVKEESVVKQQKTHFIVYPGNARNECIRYVLCIGFVLCLLHWLSPDRLCTHLPSKNEVLTIANEKIASHMTSHWDYIKSAQPVTFFSFELEEEFSHQFIWQMERTNYKTMLKKGYIALPGWAVKYAHFDGDIVKRAEQLIVRVNRSKEIMYVHHTVPEYYEGATLSEKEALDLAIDTLFEQYGFSKDDIFLRISVPSKKEKRTDWTLEYTIVKDSVLQMGEPRVQVVIIGNTIGLVKKYIHIPEKWERQFKNNMHYLNLAKNISLLVLLICILLLVGFLLTTIPLPSISSKFTLFLLIGMSGLIVLHFFNTLPIIIAGFNTIEPWFLQIGSTFGLFLIINIVFILSTTFVLASVLHIQWPTAYSSVSSLTIWGASVARGILFALSFIVCIIFFLHLNNATTLPLDYEHSILFANSYVPLFFILSTEINGYLRFLAIGLLCLYLLRILRSTKMRYIILLTATVFGLSLCIAPKAITFFGYLYIVLFCCLVIGEIAYTVYKKKSLLVIDKRADIGFITGIYSSYLYYQHCIYMVNRTEMIGGLSAIILVLLISKCFCKYTNNFDEKTALSQH